MIKNFYPTDFIISSFRENYDLNISKDFIDCADTQLSVDFFKKTGIKLNKHIGIGLGGKNDFFYSRGKISRMYSNIIINNFSNEVVIQWSSKSGRIYEPFDRDIDCADIMFSFEELDALEYHKQFQANYTLPFRLKNLSYELFIHSLNINMSIKIWLKGDDVSNTLFLMENIDKMMEAYNMNSMKKDRMDGVVHNWKRRLENDKLIYDIDTGSAGVLFLKKLLKHLSKLNCFTKVEID